jgi:hypothetical protein
MAATLFFIEKLLVTVKLLLHDAILKSLGLFNLFFF